MLLGRKFCSFHNGAAVSVCPFYCSRADIRPSRFINPLWALFPPPKEQLLSLYQYARPSPAFISAMARVPVLRIPSPCGIHVCWAVQLRCM